MAKRKKTLMSNDPYNTSLQKMITHNMTKISTKAKLGIYEKLMKKAYKEKNPKAINNITMKMAKKIPDAWRNKDFMTITEHYNKGLRKAYGMGEKDVPLIKKAKKRRKRTLKKL